MAKDDEINYVDGCPGWMMTMGDCMSLLLCFFVLLLTFSTKNKQKLMDVIGSIQGALSIMAPPEFHKHKYWYKDDQELETEKGNVQKGDKKKVYISQERLSVVNLNSMDVVNRYNEFKERILRLGFKNIVTTQQLDQGIVIKVSVDNLFKENSPLMKPNARQFLEGLVNLVSGYEGSDLTRHKMANEVRITSCFHQKQGSWILARKRLAALVFYFKKIYKIPQWRFSLGNRVLTNPKQPDMIEFLLCEKIGVSEATMDDIIKISSADQGGSI